MLKSFTAVMQDLGVSRSGLYSLIKNDQDFPKPIRITPSKKPRLFFDVKDLEQWLKSKKLQAQEQTKGSHDSTSTERGATA